MYSREKIVILMILWLISGLFFGHTLVYNNQIETNDNINKASENSKGSNFKQVLMTGEKLSFNLEKTDYDYESKLNLDMDNRKRFQGIYLNQYTNRDPILISSNSDFSTLGFSGSGSKIDPYIITGFSITGNQTQPLIEIKDTTAYFTIVDNQLNNGTYGINLENTINGNISENLLTNNADIAIRLFNSDNNTIYSNDIINNLGYSVQLFSSVNNTVDSNIITDSVQGIDFQSTSNNNTIISNVISNSENSGLFVSQSSFNQIASNQITNASNGIYMLSSNEFNNISFNTVSEMRNQGMVLGSSSIQNTLLNNSFIGKGIFQSTNSQINQLTQALVEGNTVNGKPLVFLQHLTNYVIPGEVGQIILLNCSGVEISNKTIQDTNIAVTMHHSSFNTITMNSIDTNSHTGIYLTFSYNNTFLSNTVSNNQRGFVLSFAPENNFVNNILVNDSLYLGGNTIDDVAQSEVNSNIVNGYPLVYLQEVDDHVVSGDVGQVILVNSTRIEISGKSFQNSEYGIIAFHSTNISIFSSTFEDLSHNAIRIKNSPLTSIYDNEFVNIQNNVLSIAYSPNTTISNNMINRGFFGINLSYSDNSTIDHNWIGNSNIRGLFISFTNNIDITSNIIVNNTEGIHLYISHFNAITSNIIADNSLYGIYFNSGANNNSIQFNAFTNNLGYGFYIASGHNNSLTNNYFGGNNVQGTSQGYIYEDNENNTISMNFWDDHTEPDANLDGFVDDPYPIDDLLFSFFDTNPVTSFSYDKTPPILSSPNDQEYETPITGEISWDIADLYPYKYNITLNNVNIANNVYWMNGTINLGFENLGFGSFNFTIYVYDATGHVSSDSVIISILSESDDSPPESEDGNPLLYLLIVSGVMLIVLAIGVNRRRKKRRK